MEVFFKERQDEQDYFLQLTEINGIWPGLKWVIPHAAASSFLWQTLDAPLVVSYLLTNRQNVNAVSQLAAAYLCGGELAAAEHACQPPALAPCDASCGIHKNSYSADPLWPGHEQSFPPCSSRRTRMRMRGRRNLRGHALLARSLHAV